MTEKIRQRVCLDKVHQDTFSVTHVTQLYCLRRCHCIFIIFWHISWVVIIIYGPKWNSPLKLPTVCSWRAATHGSPTMIKELLRNRVYAQ